MALGGLEVVSARALYVYCQQQEQEWRERNRIRGMEERGLGFTRFDTLFDPATPGASKRTTQSSSSVSYSGDSDSTTIPIFNAEVTGDIGALQGLSKLVNRKPPSPAPTSWPRPWPMPSSSSSRASSRRRSTRA